MGIRIKWHPQNFNNRLEKDVDKRTGRSAKEFVEFSKRYAPVESGELKASINYKKKHKMEYIVGSSVPYAKYVEYGTSKRAPNPFFRRALAAFRRKIQGNFK